MRVAALDLGSNSFLLLIAEGNSRGELTTIYDTVEIVRLGEGVAKTKAFSRAALERAEDCLRRFAELIKQHQPQKVLAVATAAARQVENASALEQICEKFQIPLQIISGDQEAQHTFAGATAHLPDDKKIRAILDIGGGSTELIWGLGPNFLDGESAAIGAVSLSEMFPEGDTNRAKKMKEHAKKSLRNVTERLMSEISKEAVELIAVAGTPTELAKAELGKFDPEQIDGFVFSRDRLVDWQKFFSSNNQEAIVQRGISEKRADVILAGTTILLAVIELLDLGGIKVSTRGVRYGVALDLVLH